MSTTHWPNRPFHPFSFYHQWGNQDWQVIYTGSAHTYLCISAIHLSNSDAERVVRFYLYGGDENEPFSFGVMVPALQTLSLLFPTPLVLSGLEGYQVTVGPVETFGGLFDATIVGYVDSDPPIVRRPERLNDMQVSAGPERPERLNDVQLSARPDIR